MEICQKDPFDIIALTPRGTLGLCCVQIAQNNEWLIRLFTQYRLPFIYQIMMDCENINFV